MSEDCSPIESLAQLADLIDQCQTFDPLPNKTLQEFGIPNDGYLMLIVHQNGHLPFSILPTFIKVSDIGLQDQYQITHGFRTVPSGMPMVSYHQGTETDFPFETISLKAYKAETLNPLPGQPLTVYGVVEVELLRA